MTSFRVRMPVVWLYLPVSTVARAGVQMELVQKQRLKRAPSLASRSRLGVATRLAP